MKQARLIQTLILFLFFITTACGSTSVVLTNDALSQGNESSTFDDDTDTVETDVDLNAPDGTIIGNPPYDENNPEDGNLDETENPDDLTPIDCDSEDSDDVEDCGEPDNLEDNNDKSTISADIKNVALTVTGSLKIDKKDFTDSACLNNLDAESLPLILFKSRFSANQSYYYHIDFVNMFKVKILSYTTYDVYFAQNMDGGIKICGLVVSSDDAGMLQPLIIQPGNDNIDLGNIRYIGGNHYLTAYHDNKIIAEPEDINELTHDDRNP